MTPDLRRPLPAFVRDGPRDILAADRDRSQASAADRQCQTMSGLLVSIDDICQAGFGGTFERLLSDTKPPGGAIYYVAGGLVRVERDGGLG